MKKAEHQRIDAFKFWCWTRLLRVPWTEMRSIQSTLKEISPEYSWERPMLKLNLQYFGYLMGRTDLLETSLMLGKIKGRRPRGMQKKNCWVASPTWLTWVWASSGSWWWTGKSGVLHPMIYRKLAWYITSSELMYREKSGSRQKSLGKEEETVPG